MLCIDLESNFSGKSLRVKFVSVTSCTVFVSKEVKNKIVTMQNIDMNACIGVRIMTRE